MTTIVCIYNSRIREKSSIKHFEKGARAGRAAPGPDRGRPHLASRCHARGAIPACGLHAISASRALCKIKASYIGRMVDKHFIFFP